MSSNSFADEMQQDEIGKPAAHKTDTHAPGPSCTDAADESRPNARAQE